MEAWYALFTKPRCEQQVGEILSAKGIETYVPIIQVRRRGRNVERPFFPRYMFIRVDFDQVGLSEVRWTPGLTDIVSFGGGPTRVPQAIIRRLKKRLHELNSGGTYSPFKHGDKVRIKSGPLRDFEAVFDAHLSSADRVRVLVNVLGNLTRTEIDVDAIEQLQ
ncbi:MAG: transcription termination/antitermination protein NusG [Anaerolineae bacterium]